MSKVMKEVELADKQVHMSISYFESLTLYFDWLLQGFPIKWPESQEIAKTETLLLLVLSNKMSFLHIRAWQISNH